LTSIHQITEKSGAPAKLREMVRQTKAEGGDVIKIFATARIRVGGKQTMTDDQIAAVCGEAKAQGMRAVMHLYPADKARNAVLAGCTGVDHGTFLDDATLQTDARPRHLLRSQLSGFRLVLTSLTRVVRRCVGFLL
jgi:imidazolonepropionase-like amidohydrolase